MGSLVSISRADPGEAPVQKSVVALVCVSLLAGARASADMGEQRFKFTAGNTNSDARFGTSVAIEGNTALVGAFRKGSSGAVYLYDVTTGSQLAEFAVEHQSDLAGYGYSVARHDNIALIGAPWTWHNGVYAGAAYLVDITTGDQLAVFSPDPNPALFPEYPPRPNEFGFSVAISGSTAVVGAPEEDDYQGSVYLYDVATRSRTAKLTMPGVEYRQKFGHSVAVSGNVAIVGAKGDWRLSSSVPRPGSGAAYLFDVTTGEQLGKLTVDDPGTEQDNFGSSVAIRGNIALVGAPIDSTEDNYAGAAYVFDITTGQRLAKLTADDAEEWDALGLSVAISGNMAIVGALDGDDAVGAAYVFDITTGEQLAKLTAEDATAADRFGWSVAIDGATAIIGAWGNDDIANNAGAAYVFDVPEPASLSLLVFGGLAMTRRRRR